MHFEKRSVGSTKDLYMGQNFKYLFDVLVHCTLNLFKTCVLRDQLFHHNLSISFSMILLHRYLSVLSVDVDL